MHPKKRRIQAKEDLAVDNEGEPAPLGCQSWIGPYSFFRLGETTSSRRFLPGGVSGSGANVQQCLTFGSVATRHFYSLPSGLEKPSDSLSLLKIVYFGGHLLFAMQYHVQICFISMIRKVGNNDEKELFSCVAIKMFYFGSDL